MAAWVTVRELDAQTTRSYRYPYHGEPLDLKNGPKRWTVWQKIVNWKHQWELAKHGYTTTTTKDNTSQARETEKAQA